MEAGGSSSSRGTGTGEFTVYGLTQNDDKQLVDSTIPFRGSVVRIIRVSKEEDVIGTSTAFLVFRGEKRSLFLTCDHNFMKKKMGEVIRFSNGDKKNYPVEKILYRDGARDLLLFSVKGDVPENHCVEFSTDKIEQHDKIVIVGHTTPSLPLGGNGELVPVLVNQPGLYRGRISATFIREDIQKYYEKITYNFPVAGESVGGAPLFRDGKVIGVHLARDGRNGRSDAVSARTVLQVLREWLGVGEDSQATIKELLQIVYDKIKPKVPNVELPSYRKKLRSESEKEEGCSSNQDRDD
ncbi:unnamed protein product [Urochloa decumbens]|uniref:Serine protease n=1 Tax=Urochloa decumbens TaxID=240449 RepID=A0ABC9G3Y8_9POAL